jgi:hypothetical protein
MLKFIPALAFLIAIGCAISANVVFIAMFDAVNRRRPDDKQIRDFLMLPSTYFDVWREYRLAHPKGLLASALIALVCIFHPSDALCLHVIRLGAAISLQVDWLIELPFEVHKYDGLQRQVARSCK